MARATEVEARSATRRRRTLLGVLVLVVGLVWVASAMKPAVSAGLAYKAKTLCSELFVAGRALDDVLRDLEVDDLRPLRFIRAEVDPSQRLVTTGVLIARRQAQFLDGRGCILGPPRGQESMVSQRPSVHGTASSSAMEKAAAVQTEFSAGLEQVLDAAFQETVGRPHKRTRAVVVVHRGEIVAERYAPGFGPETPLLGWSMTKSVMNALIGAAIQAGRLDLNEPTGLRAWSGPGDGRAAITVSDLLRMSSGLEFGEDQANLSSDLFRMLYAERDMAGFASGKRLVAEPSTLWKYSSGTSVILSQVLREKVGEEAYKSFPRTALFEPLGLTQAVLEQDGVGTFMGASYLYATAREWARIGQLYLQDGVWQDKRILPVGWVEYSRTPAPADPHGAYGAHFWVSTPLEYRGRPVPLPADAFHAAGHEAQFVTIVPSRNVVVVRMGQTRYAKAWEHDQFIAGILAALEDGGASDDLLSEKPAA